MIKQPGDEIRRVGGWLQQWRGNLLVRSWNVRTATELTAAYSTTTQINNFIFEVSMPGENVAMTNVRENQNTGAIIIDFSSGTQLEIADWAAVGEIANSIDATPELAERILLGKAYRASPDGANKTTQIGASVSVNLLASEPIVYTPAD